jgi:hypothetical protein
MLMCDKTDGTGLREAAAVSKSARNDNVYYDKAFRYLLHVYAVACAAE